MKRHLVLVAAALSSSALAAAPTRDATGVAGGLEERVARIERVLQSRNEVQLEIQQQISDLEAEAGQLRGTLELHTHQLEQILARQRDLYQDIERRLGQPGVPAGVGTPALATTPAQPVASPPVATTDVAANVAYENAFNLLKGKRYDEAAGAFSKFIAEYPGSSYIANAYYWQAQLSYRASDLSAAQTAFSTVVNNYPKSSKRAESIFKLGLIAQKQGNNAEATKRFKQVLAEYPSSSVARLAKGKL